MAMTMDTSRGRRELVTHCIEDGCHVLGVVAEIDICESPQFETEVAKAANADRIVVDLTDCHYMDSSGFHVLSRASKLYGDRLRLVATPGSAVDRVLRVLQIDTHVATFTSVDDARTQKR
jgi:anti-anti-sigma factor